MKRLYFCLFVALLLSGCARHHYPEDYSGGWHFPLPGAKVISDYGYRDGRLHSGIDLKTTNKDKIYAAFDGEVVFAGKMSGYGNLVRIVHPNGLETYYAHMSRRDVVAGQRVKSGEVIGLCGNTGRSFGSHLHFEIRYQGNAINPEDVIDCATHDLVSDQLTLSSNSFRKVSKGSRNVSNGASGGSSTGDVWYRVRKGDTLGKIARRNGTTVKRLCQLNGISANKTLRPGEKLKVRGSASPQKKSNAKAKKSKKKGKKRR